MGIKVLAPLAILGIAAIHATVYRRHINGRVEFWREYRKEHATGLDRMLYDSGFQEVRGSTSRSTREPYRRLWVRPTPTDLTIRFYSDRATEILPLAELTVKKSFDNLGAIPKPPFVESLRRSYFGIGRSLVVTISGGYKFEISNF